MVYEVKVYLLKSNFTSEVKGSVRIYKEFKRWTLWEKWEFGTKKQLTHYIHFLTKWDKDLDTFAKYKYVITQHKGRMSVGEIRQTTYYDKKAR